MKFLLQAAVVFVATVAADYAWTKYMLHTAAKHPHAAGIWSAAIILCGAISIVTYTQNPWLILPALLGAYCGTYLAVTRELTKPSPEAANTCHCTPLGKAQCWEPCGDLGKSEAHARVAPLVERWAPTEGGTGFPCHKRPQSEWCDRDGPGGFMGHTCRPKPPCDHRNCTVSESDGEVLRWSCGRIEG